MTRSAAVLLRDAGVLCRVLDVGIGRRRCASDRRPRARSGKKGRARGRRFGGARRITRRGRAGARGRRDARQRSDRAGEGEASGSSVVHPAESCKARASRQRGLARRRPSLREEAAEPSTHPFNSRFENWPLAVRESQDAPRSAQRSNVHHASRRTWTSRAAAVGAAHRSFAGVDVARSKDDMPSSSTVPEDEAASDELVFAMACRLGSGESVASATPPRARS